MSFKSELKQVVKWCGIVFVLIVIAIVIFEKSDKEKTEFVGNEYYYDLDLKRIAIFTDSPSKENVLICDLGIYEPERFHEYLKKNISLFESGTFSFERFNEHYIGSPSFSGKTASFYITFEKPLVEGEDRRGFSGSFRYNSLMWISREAFDNMRDTYELGSSIPIKGHTSTYTVRTLGKYHQGP